MPFTLDSWKQAISQRLEDWQSRWERVRNRGTAKLYPFLAATALWPVVQAVHDGDPAAWMVLGGVVAGVGSNLLANVVQDWANVAHSIDEADGAEKLAAAAADHAALRAELDAVLDKLDVLPQAQDAVDENNRAWFAETLRAELAALGNLARYDAVLKGGGALVQGDNAVGVGERGVNVVGDVEGSIFTGDNNQNVRADTYIDNRKIVSAPDKEDPLALRSAYLHHLFETVGQLTLSGIDPKAASEAEAQLNLGAVYTALLTLTPEECEDLQNGDAARLGGDAARLEMMQRHAQGEVRRLSVVAQLDRHARLVLLGDPGSGKSTFVNFVALCMAGDLLGKGAEGQGAGGIGLARLREPLPPEEEEGRRDDEKKEPEPQPWSHGALLPVRVVLRDFAARGLPPVGERATARHLWDFIVAELAAVTLDEYPQYLMLELRHRGGLLLLDGLDEVPEAGQRREQLKQAVEDFARTFGKCRVLVTSRTYAYQQQAWRLHGFAEAVLAPFGRGQITRFVERWYAHIAQVRGMHTGDAEGRAELLKHAIFGSERLRELAERPLLLTLMASLHAWRGGSLPEKREELYADTVDLLLDWWERPKVVRDKAGVIVQQPSLAEWLRVDRNKVRVLLECLAYAAHAGQPALTGTADVPEGDLLSGLLHLSQNPDVKHGRLVDYLSNRAGLLLPRGVGVYTFPHRTFQEYLAACHLTDHDYPEKVAELARSDPNRWREVALLAGAKAARGTASAVWSLVDALCYTDIDLPGSRRSFREGSPHAWGALLAGQALVENADLGNVSERNQRKLARVKAHLAALMQVGQLPAVERALAGNTLAKLADPRPEVMTVDGMQFCYVPPGPFWMGSEENSRERPLHLNEHLTSGYWIARYPVTVAQFRAFIAATGQEHYARSLQGTDNHPARYVNWHEARAFCDWLTARWRANGWLAEGQTVRLPTEAEWEKAARGGLELPESPLIVTGCDFQNPQSQNSKSVNLTFPALQPLTQNPQPQRRYPWGDDADPDCANYGDTGLGDTSAVGCFPGGRTPYGAEDMSGNVWEWTLSLYKSYPYILKDGREDEKDKNDFRVLRGGAFVDCGVYARCAYRDYYPPHFLNYNIGFRVVLVASPFSPPER